MEDNPDLERARKLASQISEMLTDPMVWLHRELVAGVLVQAFAEVRAETIEDLKGPNLQPTAK